MFLGYPETYIANANCTFTVDYDEEFKQRIKVKKGQHVCIKDITKAIELLKKEKIRPYYDIFDWSKPIQPQILYCPGILTGIYDLRDKENHHRIITLWELVDTLFQRKVVPKFYLYRWELQAIIGTSEVSSLRDLLGSNALLMTVDEYHEGKERYLTKIKAVKPLPRNLTPSEPSSNLLFYETGMFIPPKTPKWLERIIQERRGSAR